MPDVAQMEPPFTDERFSIVPRTWSAFLSGMIDVLSLIHPEVVWRPAPTRGPELRSQQDAANCLREMRTKGTVDPRAYGAAPRGPGLIVLGTLEMWRDAVRSETPVSWLFCFREAKVALPVGVDQRDEAVQILRERCAA